ncbi:MAG: ATP-binding cassette domain-containing protein [Gammaproteobacteria bacterium]|nr:ATP-binding cassette domain-containing protein [Gammaproteobacteria bacterium]
MLTLNAIDAFYGPVQVLRSVSLEVSAGETVALLGRNGAGKTTTLKAAMGLVEVKAGSIRVDGAEIAKLPAHRVPGYGLAYVPQGRRLFGALTVRENLALGRAVRGGSTERRAKVLNTNVLALFPALEALLERPAAELSGGQQQMVAMARALSTQPKVLLLDEPAEGLMPAMVQRVINTVQRLKAAGVAMVLVEQKLDVALRVADRVVFIENGRIAKSSTPEQLAAEPAPLARYVGVSQVL